MHTKKNHVKKKQNDNRQTALCGVLVALGMVLSYLENLIPINALVPGVKLGIANIVTIVAIVKLGFRPALTISVGRVVLSGLLFGNLLVIVYSLAGAFLSIVVMWLVMKLRLFSYVGISVCGAIAHNLGQLIVAVILLENQNIMYYMLVLVVTGTISGALIGFFAAYVLREIHM